MKLIQTISRQFLQLSIYLSMIFSPLAFATGLPKPQRGSAGSGDYVAWAEDLFKSAYNFVTNGVGAIAVLVYVVTLLVIWNDDKKDNTDLFKAAIIGIVLLVAVYFFLGEGQGIFGSDSKS